VYKIKYNADGSIERFKARLVTLGNHQVEGEDFNETFAPVAKMFTVCTLLTITTAKGWSLHQMDVHDAFFHGDLQEDIYRSFPQAFTLLGLMLFANSSLSMVYDKRFGNGFSSLPLHCGHMGFNDRLWITLCLSLSGATSFLLF